MGNITWRKPSGLEIEINDLPANVEYCKSLGWEQLTEGAPAPAGQVGVQPPDDAAVNTPTAGDLTTEQVLAMTRVELKALAKSYGLDVDTNGELGELRNAAAAALLGPVAGA